MTKNRSITRLCVPSAETRRNGTTYPVSRMQVESAVLMDYGQVMCFFRLKVPKHKATKELSKAFDEESQCFGTVGYQRNFYRDRQDGNDCLPSMSQHDGS